MAVQAASTTVVILNSSAEHLAIIPSSVMCLTKGKTVALCTALPPGNGTAKGLDRMTGTVAKTMLCFSREIRMMYRCLAIFLVTVSGKDDTDDLCMCSVYVCVWMCTSCVCVYACLCVCLGHAPMFVVTSSRLFFSIAIT